MTKEPIGELIQAAEIKPLLQPRTVYALIAVSVSIGSLVLLLFAIGATDFGFFLSAFFILAGGYCIAVFLGQQYKTALQSKQLAQLIDAIAKTREQQSGIAIRYSGLQENFKSLVDEATEKAVKAKNDYQEKLGLLQTQFDRDLQNRIVVANAEVATATGATKAIAIRYLDETKKVLASKISPDNFNQSKDKFLKAVEFCRKVGFDPSVEDVQTFLDEIKIEYKSAVKKQLAREEQARIKEKLREEQKVEAEFQREMKRLEQEEKLLERLLQEARSKATEETASQIADLERRLAEAKDKERALSMAQQTKAGNVYVISNIGSFGDGVFKIGMTRRLEPLDRIRELGDASVPFPFDVHMMIACQNAPTLENGLHRKFTNRRMNKVNFRKEFFRVSLDEIRSAVEELHGEVAYQAEPEALQYRESIEMSDEQFEAVSELSEVQGDEDEE